MTIKPQLSPSQTVGPFFAYGLTPGEKYPQNDLATGQMVDGSVTGERVRLEGKLFDGAGNPINDAFIEVWQADGKGQFNATNSNFKGFGRCATNDQGEFWFNTIKPASYGGNAPHLSLHILARGVLTHLYTRVYFAGDDVSQDNVMNLVPVERRETLIAKKQGDKYLFDIHIHGEKENVFFEVSA
jgi:protocatechuate 3,4-dioxygenase, alpha subunit